MPDRRVASHQRKTDRSRADLEDLLCAISDRADLERLFDREVALCQILKLAGREVSTEAIQDLLGSPDPAGDVKKLLDS